METTVNWMSIAEAAEQLGITGGELLRRVYDEDFPTVWVNGRMRIPADAVAATDDPT